jgi:hypothetical protein
MVHKNLKDFNPHVQHVIANKGTNMCGFTLLMKGWKISVATYSDKFSAYVLMHVN